MWIALAAASITSSLFLTALAPNLLALAIMKNTIGFEIGWVQWFLLCAPAGLILLLVLPVLVYIVYPPDVAHGEQAPGWAKRELDAMGPISWSELLLAALVLLAVTAWIVGTTVINPTTVALVIVALMSTSGLLTFEDIVSNTEAWKALIMLATLVTLADGLSRTGFVRWFAAGAASQFGDLPVTFMLVALVVVYYFAHYLFASITAHVTAMLPIMLSVGASIPGFPTMQFAILLAFTHGFMGVLTPYATTSGPVYLGSGYLTSTEFWRLGALFGTIFLAALLVLSGPFIFAFSSATP